MIINISIYIHMIDIISQFSDKNLKKFISNHFCLYLHSHQTGRDSPYPFVPGSFLSSYPSNSPPALFQCPLSFALTLRYVLFDFISDRVFPYFYISYQKLALFPRMKTRKKFWRKPMVKYFYLKP